jgi:ADP-ribose pyrophosphatase YjhB (NUDIX family)
MQKKFNIRVYGILIKNQKVLLNEEFIKGRKIIKFPGGGLDWGEGIADCLKREWMEELGIDIALLDHFYTTDFFQQSAFDDSQIISIYYLIDAEVPDLILNKESNERSFWLPLNNLHTDTFTLPIDQRVGNKLIALLKA